MYLSCRALSKIELAQLGEPWNGAHEQQSTSRTMRNLPFYLITCTCTWNYNGTYNKDDTSTCSHNVHMKEILQTKTISLKCLAKIFLTERKPFPIFGTSNKAVRVLYLYHSQSTYTSKKSHYYYSHISYIWDTLYSCKCKSALKPYLIVLVPLWY